MALKWLTVTGEKYDGHILTIYNMRPIKGLSLF